MKNKNFLRLNVFCYLVIAAFLASAVVTSLGSGHPWAITCYNCSSCSRSCPLAINPSGFTLSAIGNNPELYLAAANIRLRLNEAAERDPEMMVTIKGKGNMKAGQALSRGISLDTEVTTFRMKAKDAAQYCLLCGVCEKDCPIKLPIMDIIEDLRNNGKFNR
jgi:Fe-S oxidoreductase